MILKAYLAQYIALYWIRVYIFGSPDLNITFKYFQYFIFKCCDVYKEICMKKISFFDDFFFFMMYACQI